MTRHLRSRVVWFAGLGLALALYVASVMQTRKPEGSLLVALLGPVATFAAELEWVRFDLALRAGDVELAYARAETALWIDPGATMGWNTYAAHLAFDRAAPEREPDAARRGAWFDAALAVLARGEASARQPAELALFAGLLRLDAWDHDPARFGATPRVEVERLAADDFERAARLGHPLAAELAHTVRERAAR
ncbi:MAG: hypothetical protein L6Q99_09560 [Planctomycetes bacterium]|nr:hypothetical protein [Planctomycetota bacterium]